MFFLFSSTVALLYISFSLFCALRKLKKENYELRISQGRDRMDLLKLMDELQSLELEHELLLQEIEESPSSERELYFFHDVEEIEDEEGEEDESHHWQCACSTCQREKAW